MDALNKEIDFGLMDVNDILKPYHTNIHGDLEQEYENLSLYASQRIVRKESDSSLRKDSYIRNSMNFLNARKRKAMIA